MTRRVIASLHPSEVGKYPCYLCGRGSDSFMRCTVDSNERMAGRLDYTVLICSSCVTRYDVDVAREYQPAPPTVEPYQEPAQTASRAEETPVLDWGSIP